MLSKQHMIYRNPMLSYRDSSLVRCDKVHNIVINNEGCSDTTGIQMAVFLK